MCRRTSRHALAGGAHLASKHSKRTGDKWTCGVYPTTVKVSHWWSSSKSSICFTFCLWSTLFLMTWEVIFIFSPCKVQWVFKKTQKYPRLQSKLPHLLDCFFWAFLGAERSDFTLPTEQTPSEQPCCFVWMVPPDWSGSRSHREPWSAHKPATPPALCFSSPLHLMLQICPPMDLKKEKC